MLKEGVIHTHTHTWKALISSRQQAAGTRHETRQTTSELFEKVMQFHSILNSRQRAVSEREKDRAKEREAETELRQLQVQQLLLLLLVLPPQIANKFQAKFAIAGRDAAASPLRKVKSQS